MAADASAAAVRPGYARDYGGFGVVLALSFWILFSAGLIVVAASASPSLVELRRRRQQR